MGGERRHPSTQTYLPPVNRQWGKAKEKKKGRAKGDIEHPQDNKAAKPGLVNPSTVAGKRGLRKNRLIRASLRPRNGLKKK